MRAKARTAAAASERGVSMNAKTSNVTLVDHPLVQHKLTLMRKRETTVVQFRQLAREVALLLAYEVTRDLPMTTTPIETPLAEMIAPTLAGKKLCFVSILRAGDGLLQGMLDLVPSARVGHIGIYRDPETLTAVEYYYKVPEDMQERPVVVVDPMLATGNSAVAAVSRLREDGAQQIKFACLLAAPEGIEQLRSAHPEVPIFTAAIDKRLNDHGYIVPGLGDAGDRLYGTK
jgi:uracil phosphoribosyltransferase